MSTGKIIAHTLSYILHPLLMTFYCIALLFVYTTFYDIYYNSAFIVLFTIIIFSVIIPYTFIFLLKKLGFIKKVSAITRSEKNLPYLMAIFSNSMMIYYFYTTHMSFWFLGLLAAPTIALFIGFIVNIFWKISAHMIGIGSLIGATFSICFNVKGLNPFILFIILFILAGCLGVSRLYLKQNTPAQVYTGFIVGFGISFLTVWGSLMLALLRLWT